MTQIVSALERSRGGNSTGSRAMDSGIMNAAPRPSTARAAINVSAFGAQAHAAEASPNTTRAAISKRLRP